MKIVDTSIVRKSIELNENFKLVVAKDPEGISIKLWNGETEITLFEGTESLAKGVAEVLAETSKTIIGTVPKPAVKRGRKPKKIVIGES